MGKEMASSLEPNQCTLRLDQVEFGCMEAVVDHCNDAGKLWLFKNCSAGMTVDFEALTFRGEEAVDSGFYFS